MFSKFITFSVLTVMTLAVIFGFSIADNPTGSRTVSKNNSAINPPSTLSDNAAIIYVDSLNGSNDTTSLKARGYKVYYRGTGPQGATATWYQGSDLVFNAYNGPTTGYVAANFNVVTGTNNIDSWLVSPRLNISAGDSLRFWERSVDANPFPDSMRIMYSAVGDSTPEATSWVELGRFLNSINGSWFERKYRLPTAGANARFALRYNVVNGGPSGANSNYIGVDYITVSGSGAPPSCTYTWTSQVSGTTQLLYSVSAVSNLIGWAAGAAGTVVKTTNGTTWTNANPNPGVISGDIYNIYAWSANDAIVTTSPGTGTFIYKTSNGGTNWTQVYTLAGATAFLNVLQMISPTEGYGFGDPVAGKWTIVKTTDGGNTWARMATEPTVTGEAGWNNAAQIIGNNMWFGTNATKVYRSTDLGLTWTSGATTGTVNSYSVHYNSATSGLAAGTATVKSIDGGATYTSTGSPGTSGNIAGLTGAGTDWWAVRSGTDIYRSTNQGATWTTAFTVAAAAFDDIDFKVVNGCPTGWAVGSGGAIAKMSPVVGISNYNTEIPASFSLDQNFPNPFNPSTNIKFSVPSTGLVTLKIYDMSGQEVATLVNEVKSAGNYLVGFNASHLASGTYIYRIETPNFTEAKKMLLVK